MHIACEFGHSEVVEWILSKPELKADVNSLNGNALSPLFLTCLKGYVGADGLGSRTAAVKVKRMEIAKLLLEKGANINFTREVVGLTPLHWAAYNDDAELCRFLLAKGALQKESTAGSMPVDIAGFMGNKKVIRVFMENLAAKIDKRFGVTGPGHGEVDLDKPISKSSFNELEYLNKLKKSEKTG